MGSSSISVRGLAAVAALCALFCVGVASASAAPLVWLANSSQESVSTMDGVAGKEVASPIPVGKRPQWIAITPNGRRAIVLTSNGGDSAVVIDTTARKVLKSIPLGNNGEGVAISPDGSTAYATDEGDDEVHVIGPETATALGTIKVGGDAEALAFSPDGSEAYVGVLPEEIVTVDTQTEEVVGNAIDVGGNPEWIAFTPDGKTAYVTASGINGVVVVSTALRQAVKTIPTSEGPRGIAVSPDGKNLYIGNPNDTVSVAETATDAIVGSPIAVPAGVDEIAIAPSGKIAWVAGGEQVTPVNLLTEKAEAAVATTGAGVSNLAIAPDQSPIAAFTAPSATVGTPASFSGAASTDPDGSVVTWNWAFGDGGVGSGVSTTHTYRAVGTYNAKLSVVDNEGCGEEEVFTGRTAYCSGAAPAVHAVTAKAPAVEPIAGPAAPPSNKFAIKRLIHNRANGTVRLQVKLPSAGFVLLFGKKVHAVTRKSKGVQSMWLTIHARVELNKRLKTILRAPVKFRVTFTPNGGRSTTVHRTVTLERAPRRAHGEN